MSKQFQRVKELLLYMQSNVDGPTQWVTFSHKVLFYMCDEDTWQPEKARVFVAVGKEDYRIKYRSSRKLETEEDWTTSFTVFTAHSLEEAGQMIELAFQLAENNLPGRFDKHQ